MGHSGLDKWGTQRLRAAKSGTDESEGSKRSSRRDGKTRTGGDRLSREGTAGKRYS